MRSLIKKLTTDDWQIFKDIRLQMLSKEPQAFTTTFAQVSEYTEEEWRNRTAGDRVIVLVIFVDGKPAGMNGMYYKNEEKEAVTIWGMYIKKELRRMGLGEKLMNAIEQEIRKDQAVKKIKICVKSSQTPAWELYKKRGFVEVTRNKDKTNVRGELYDEIHMEKDVI